MNADFGGFQGPFLQASFPFDPAKDLRCRSGLGPELTSCP
jgi:hypothetical protein